MPRLTMTEAKELIESKGLTIRSNMPFDLSPGIYYNDEWVGYMTQNCVVLHKDLPSLGTFSSPSETVSLTAEDADVALEIKIDLLKDSPRRYEERLRQRKLEVLRDYFNR